METRDSVKSRTSRESHQTIDSIVSRLAYEARNIFILFLRIRNKRG
jgi:hypothetical protein